MCRPRVHNLRVGASATSARVRKSLVVAEVALALSIALARYLASLFFGVSPTSFMTYLEVGFAMVVIALVACLLPAWRALRVDPMVSLRYE